MGDNIKDLIEQYPAYWALIKIFALLTAALIVHSLLKNYFIRLIKKAVGKTKTEWDDILFRNKVFNKLIDIVPAMMIYNFARLFGSAEELVERIALSYIIFACTLFVSSVLNGINDIYQTYPFSKDKPVKGYIQTVKLIFYITAFLIIISVLMDKSPVLLLSGIGAMMAVILLIFKDTILSLVASIQIRANDLIKIGDWITMPKFDADGDVIDIALHTVKVQNFDRTITTIPTHKFIEESFQNWRGMSESGGRRIKRSVNIDLTTIKFLDAEDIEKYRNIRVLKEYINSKVKEIEEFNRGLGEPEKNFVNQRNLTNIGTFRMYLKHYLKNHPHIASDMTFLIRQIAPGPEGLPIEIYVFANDNRWVQYEEIQADIFDHVLSVVPQFGLSVYQRPSGKDIKFLKEGILS
ncbi:MAG: mechanosensitive ion channel [Candidatus Delongbacteria bacterium]|nr:mechanosensitive ion channel [Candidatus Delongbacteria bacterium]